MSQKIEWQNFQTAYSTVQLNEKISTTDSVLSWLAENKKITQYINTQTVLARQTTKAENINTLNTSVKKGDWIVLQEQNTFTYSSPEFEFLYDTEAPVEGSGIIKMYRLRRQNFWGTVYEGKQLTIIDSKNTSVILEEGDLIGSYESTITKNNFVVIKKETRSSYFKEKSSDSTK